MALHLAAPATCPRALVGADDEAGLAVKGEVLAVVVEEIVVAEAVLEQEVGAPEDLRRRNKMVDSMTCNELWRLLL
jgi:hypothetical protein